MTPFLAAAISEMLTDADPGRCHRCGHAWDLDVDQAIAAIEQGPERYASLLESATRPASGTSTAWSPSAYVWHVGDVTRAWAERLHTLRYAPGTPWAGFDPDRLAEARNYAELPAPTAPWALGVATGALFGLLGDLDTDTTFEHPEWGPGSVADALRWVAHEVVHHQLDVSGDLDRS